MPQPKAVSQFVLLSLIDEYEPAPSVFIKPATGKSPSINVVSVTNSNALAPLLTFTSLLAAPERLVGGSVKPTKSVAPEGKFVS